MTAPSEARLMARRIMVARHVRALGRGCSFDGDLLVVQGLFGSVHVWLEDDGTTPTRVIAEATVEAVARDEAQSIEAVA